MILPDHHHYRRGARAGRREKYLALATALAEEYGYQVIISPGRCSCPVARTSASRN
jgi:hypothetical protein